MQTIDNQKPEFLFTGYDANTGVYCFIAINSTLLGPALGGIRMQYYESTAEAILDAKRLSLAMTRKAASAGIPFGGGKTVIRLPHPEILRLNPNLRQEIMLKIAQWLQNANAALKDSSGASYWGGEDVGINASDVLLIAKYTQFVLGLPQGLHPNGRVGGGDPSPMTALGIEIGMEIAIEKVYGATGERIFEGKTIVIQGAGKVGSALAQRLLARACPPQHIIVFDTNSIALNVLREKTGASEHMELRLTHNGTDVYSQPCDIFSPCAMGGILNENTIAQLRCRIVAGSANNQLATPQDGWRLHKRGILYAPDYIINAGGLINIAEELKDGCRGYRQESAEEKVRKIRNRLELIFAHGQKYDYPTSSIADAMTEIVLQNAHCAR